MKSYVAFIKKELIESIRTYRLVIMLTVFLLFGIISPLLAKLTPELLKYLGTGDLVITLPELTAMDSWAQFFKNVGQMGMLVLVIVFAGTMANELSRGTLVNVLTKGLNRKTVILSKFSVAVVIWTLAYLLCLGVALAYTIYLWGDVELENALAGFVAPWLFGCLLIALLIFGGTLFGSFSGSLLLAGCCVIAMSLVAIMPALQKYNPIMLSGDQVALFVGARPLDDVIPAILVCASLTVLLIVASVLVFNKKQL